MVINGGIEAFLTGIGFGDAADGNYFLDLNGVGSPGGVAQTLVTSDGQAHEGTFSLAGNSSRGPDYAMRLAASGFRGAAIR